MFDRTACVAAALCVAFMAGTAAAQTAGVTVLRGTDSTAAGDGVTVVRGSPAPAAANPAAYRTKVVLPVIAAGNTLWLRAARSGRLVACQVGGSGYVGRPVIRCTAP